MKILKASTKAGQNIVDRYNRLYGRTLRDLYGSYSYAKESAYNDCLRWFNQSKEAHDFKVGSANTFGFSAGWKLIYDGHYAIRLETKDNSYVVLLDM